MWRQKERLTPPVALDVQVDNLSKVHVGSNTDSEEEDEDIPISIKKAKEGETPCIARDSKKKGKQTGATCSWLHLARCRNKHR